MRSHDATAVLGDSSTVQLKTAIGAFFVEFSKFEGRLTLLDRMAHARGISLSIMGELDALLLRARKLREQRDEIARNLATIDAEDIKPHLGSVPRRLRVSRSRRADLAQLAEVEQLWTPGLVQVQQFATEAIELQEMMRTIVEKMDQEVTPDDPMI
jgi:hypothetical protein